MKDRSDLLVPGVETEKRWEISRRDMLVGMGAFAGTALLSSCASNEDYSDIHTSPATTSPTVVETLSPPTNIAEISGDLSPEDAIVAAESLSCAWINAGTDSRNLEDIYFNSSEFKNLPVPDSLKAYSDNIAQMNAEVFAPVYFVDNYKNDPLLAKIADNHKVGNSSVFRQTLFRALKNKAPHTMEFIASDISCKQSPSNPNMYTYTYTHASLSYNDDPNGPDDQPVVKSTPIRFSNVIERVPSANGWRWAIRSIKTIK
ncbi:hypothetical protein EUA66_01100 [TM7 phylum sp. oral taxon 349]|nr:hypothetical protein EUA66_01100 [TM7 phylum sp. oral taxon 349]